MFSSPRSPDLKFDEIAAQVQNIVIERELVLRHTQWVVADSRRLLEQTQRLLDSTHSARGLRRAAGLVKGPARD